MQVEGQHAALSGVVMATGARVSNAYPTCPVPGHSPSKDGLMPYVLRNVHAVRSKGIFRYGMGMRPISLPAG